jgi:hypothetical protein
MLLAARVQTKFNAVYQNVVLDKYCTDYDNNYNGEVKDFMGEVRIVGMGRSLGTWLQTVLCSDPHISKRCLSMGKHNHRPIQSSQDGVVYIGFANWGTKLLILGMESLEGTRSCSNNLIVQFQGNPINQGLQLARTLLAAYDAVGDGQKNLMTSTNAASEDNDDHQDEMPAMHGVKFVMLLSGHLAPVMLRGDIASMIPRRAITLLLSTMGKSSNQKQQRNVKDVADVVVSYIRSLKAQWLVDTVIIL